MITEVRLQGWRSHADSKLTFTPGTNALIGIMGSGKSSIMDAICFALFGTFPNLQAKKLKLDDIIMKKPNERNDAEVELKIHLGGTDYTIKRMIERGKGTTFSEIRSNGNVIESPSSSRVSEAVEKILKVNYELFSKAIYSEQNALDYFLTIPRGQRMKKIDELLMIDRFEKARTNSVSLINRLIDRRAAKQSIIENTDVSRIEKMLMELKESRNEILLSIEQMKRQLVEVGEKKKGMQGELEGLKKIKEEFEFLKRDEKGIDSSIEEISKSLTHIEEAVKGKSREDIERESSYARAKIDELKGQLLIERKEFDEKFQEIRNRKEKIGGLKREIEILEAESKSKQEKKEEFERIRSSTGLLTANQLEEKKKEREQIIEDANAIKAKMNDTHEFILHLSSPETKCPICDTVLTPERKKLLIVQKEGQTKKLEESFENVKSKKEIIETEIANIEETIEKLSKIMEEIKDLEILKRDLEILKKEFLADSNEIIYLENAFSEIKKNVDKTEEQIKENELNLRRYDEILEKIKEYEEMKFRHEQLLQEKVYVEKELQEKQEKFSGKDIVAVDDELKRTIAVEREYEVRINSMQQMLREKEERIAEQQGKLNEIEKYREEVQKLEQLIKNLKIFSQALEQTQYELRTEFVEAVNYTMNKLWQTLYPYHDFAEIRLQVEEGDYIMQLQEKKGNWINVEGIASGGERSIAALALRIAFALVLTPQLRWLILDEPTANLDSKTIEDLAETLRDKIAEFVDQVFLITHDEKLENAVTGSLYRLEREKEKDGATKIITVG